MSPDAMRPGKHSNEGQPRSFRLIPISSGAAARAVDKFQRIGDIKEFIKGFKKSYTIYEKYHRRIASVFYPDDAVKEDMYMAGIAFFQSAIEYESLVKHRSVPKLRLDGTIAYVGDLSKADNVVDESDRFMAGRLTQEERNAFNIRCQEEEAKRMSNFSEVEPAVDAAINRRGVLFQNGITEEDFNIFRWGVINGHYLHKANYEQDEMQRSTGIRGKFSVYFK